MPWDSDKSTASDPDNPQADEQLTADEWDNHVSEGHFPSDELNFGVDGNGDPVITDPQNGGQTVMRYDRSAGSWVVDALEAEGAVIGGDHHYAKYYDGADADARLDNALSAATRGDIIYLENARYTDDRTNSNSIAVGVQFRGHSAGGRGNVSISGSWEFSAFGIELRNTNIDDFDFNGSLTMTANACSVHGGHLDGPITIEGDGCAVLDGYGADVTFENGTTNGIADGLYRESTVTDNGSNTVGDIE